MSSVPLDVPFETSVIGSLPRPGWVLDLVRSRDENRVSEEEFQRHLDDAVPIAVIIQELAGIDVITDGEWRRRSYISGFPRHVGGFGKDLIEVTVLDGTKRTWPAVTGKLVYLSPIAVDECRFVINLTGKRVKATLPSPYMVERWFNDPVHTHAVYPRRQDLIEDAAAILRQELLQLRTCGVDTVQFDDAMIGRLVGDEYNASGLNPNVRVTMADRDAELELAVYGINRAVEGVTGMRIGVHVCRGHRARKHVAHGGYEPIMASLRKMNVQILAMEFAAEDTGSVDVLSQFPDDKILGLGVIDVLSDRVDPPQVLVGRVERAMQYVDWQRISLNPDCGFAPSSENPIPLREAANKLSSIAQAARILRDRYA
jgi:5-methyltetrahydropteroyltriglutamate--homocysteine methyltransferase